jgi:FixJ family two-component response regulator
MRASARTRPWRGSPFEVAIHIVEDDPAVCDSLAMVLREMGHEAVAHRDAESFFERPPPEADDVIIVDLSLPGISGAQVIRWLQRLARPPRVVAITGQPHGTIERALRGLSVPTLLRKPLSQEAVAGAL